MVRILRMCIYFVGWEGDRCPPWYSSRHFKVISSWGLSMTYIPTNKTQVFNEISMMENCLIIHVINSQPLLVLYSWYIYFSQSWRFLLCTARVKNAKIFFENSHRFFTWCTSSKINQCKILHIPIVLNSSNAMPEFLDFNSRNYHM